MAAIARIAICAHYLMFVLTGSERARRSPLCVFWFRYTISSLSVYSDSVRHLREFSFLPYGHPKTGTHTYISQTPLRYYRRHVYDLLHNYILTNNNYDAAVNRARDLIVAGT